MKENNECNLTYPVTKYKEESLNFDLKIEGNLLVVLGKTRVAFLLFDLILKDFCE